MESTRMGKASNSAVGWVYSSCVLDPGTESYMQPESADAVQESKK